MDDLGVPPMTWGNLQRKPPAGPGPSRPVMRIMSSLASRRADQTSSKSLGFFVAEVTGLDRENPSDLMNH